MNEIQKARREMAEYVYYEQIEAHGNEAFAEYCEQRARRSDLLAELWAVGNRLRATEIRCEYESQEANDKTFRAYKESDEAFDAELEKRVANYAAEYGDF